MIRSAHEELAHWLKQSPLPPKVRGLIQDFHESYVEAIRQSLQPEESEALFKQWVSLVIQSIPPPSFSIFHQRVRSPFDYYQFGLDFIRPFIDFSRSRIFGEDQLREIQSQLAKKENVFLLANHQTEPDPQVISLLLEKRDPRLAEEMVFVAGHRVISDPMAIPLSLGRNLLCIYSKKHLAYPPEKREEKVLHNQRTIKKMGELLEEGGYCIYVAPSGGRDRLNNEGSEGSEGGVGGQVEVAPFDPQSIELFWLLAQKASPRTHFYPLALKTYELMPPPRQVEKELGEKRVIHFTPVYLAFGEEIEMEHFQALKRGNNEKGENRESQSENGNKKDKRNQRAESIWKQVQEAYRAFP